MEHDRPFWEQLPEIYQADPLMDQLTAVLEAPFLQNEAVINGLPKQLYDASQTPEAFLDFLARLVGLANDRQQFTVAQLRALIPVACTLQLRKGTRGGMESLVRIYLEALCGYAVEPVIVEYGDWQDQNVPKVILEQYPKLYGKEADFTVLVPAEPALESAEEQLRLSALIREYAPAVSHPHLWAGEMGTHLGEEYYLGWSSWL